MGRGNTSRCRKDFCVLRTLYGLLHVLIGIITPLLQHSQYRKRTVHYRYDGTLSDGDLFLRAGSLALLHRFGSSAAFVKLNSMGADMADIQPEYITLWIQVIVYFGLSVWVYKKKLEA